jgi:hypothetical protein
MPGYRVLSVEHDSEAVEVEGECAVLIEERNRLVVDQCEDFASERIA